MTTPTEAPAGSTPARRPRRAPGDLPFDFLDGALVDAIAAARQEPAWLIADRRAALASFDALPVEPNQLYTPYLDLRAADLFGAAPYTASVDASGGEVPEDASALIEVREDGVVKLAVAPDAAELGVLVETFAQALARDPEAVRVDLEGAPGLPADDKLAQLTRAAWSQGVRLEIPARVRLERPILVRWLAGTPATALLTRTIISVGWGAEASVVEELLPSGPRIDCAEGETVPQALFAGTLEVRLAREATLSVASLQEAGPRHVVLQHRHATLGEGATMRWALAQLGSRLVRSRIDNRLEGDRSSLEQVEILFGSEDQLFDLTTYTRHVGQDTTGDVLAKGALKDRARTYMKGLATIERSAIGTDSYLGEFGMNLSKQARSVAIPSLEIDQPDCRRAAHSSSVGPIDEEQVFYLESRGIPEDEARKFIVLGFLEPVVARIPVRDVQERIRARLEAKWAGEPAAVVEVPA
jgi:Fe-S cluster assembly scaffold protein SufB